jgi:hypothetical protein
MCNHYFNTCSLKGRDVKLRIFLATHVYCQDVRDAYIKPTRRISLEAQLSDPILFKQFLSISRVQLLWALFVLCGKAVQK